MKDAKSMYRGGDIVEAKHCDFDSSRLLGLVCPFCNEAVYLAPWEAQIERFSNPDRKAADEKYYALLEEAKRKASANLPEPQSPPL